MDKFDETRREIEGRRKAIRDQIVKLEQEDHDLEIADRALQRLASQPPQFLEGSYRMATGVATVAGPSATRPVTIKEMIVSYLEKTSSLWRTANDIQDNVSDMRGSPVPMSSISPTLSDMKKAGTIVRDGMKVALAERIKREFPDFFEENGEAEASPDTDQGSPPDQISQPSHGGA